MQMCHSGVDKFLISWLPTKVPGIKTTAVVDRSFPFCDQEVLSVHCVPKALDVLILYLSQDDKLFECVKLTEVYEI